MRQCRDGRHGRHHVGTLRGDDIRGRFVDQGAMLDAAHAQLGAAAYRFGGMAMGGDVNAMPAAFLDDRADLGIRVLARSEEHTSELQSLMRISYAVFCLKKKKQVKYSHSVNKNYKKHQKQ